MLGASQQLIKSIRELAVGEWLAQETVGAALHRFDGRGLVGERAHDQDQHLGLDRDQLFHALDAIHLRHGDVHRHDVRLGAAEQLHRLLAVAGRADELQPGALV